MKMRRGKTSGRVMEFACFALRISCVCTMISLVATFAFSQEQESSQKQPVARLRDAASTVTTVKLDSLRSSDTVKVRIQKVHANLDSLERSVDARLDTLTRLPQPDTVLTNKLNKLKTSITSLKARAVEASGISAVTESANELQASVDKLIADINEKLKPFQENGAYPVFPDQECRGQAICLCGGLTTHIAFTRGISL